MSLRRSLRLTHALIRRHRVRLLLALVIAILAAGLSMLSMLGRMQFIQQAYGWVGMASLGDAVLWLFMGHPSSPPAGWVAIWCALCAAALLDLQGAGRFDQGIVAAGSRSWAWVAYVMAGMLLAAMTYLLMIAACLALSLLAGFSPTLSPASIADISIGLVASGSTVGDVVAFLGLGFLGAVFLGLLELVAGLWAGGVASFGLAAAMLVVSAFASAVPLPGSFLMACRVLPLGTGFSPGGAPPLPSGLGLPVLIVPSALLALAGALRFSTLDLCIKDKGARR